MDTALRVMIIEDSVDDAMLLLRELRKQGFEVVHERTDTPESVRAALERRSWDLILADFNMPGFNGLDALKIVRESGLDLPFIIVSGTIGEETAVETMKAGAHDYIIKGRYARLAPAIERELKEARIRMERRKAAEEISQAREEWERTFNSIVDPILIVDSGYRVTNANQAMSNKLGVTKAEAACLPCFALVHQLKEPPRYCPLAQLLDDGLPHQVEIHEPRLGGYFLVSGSPLRDSVGDMYGCVCNYRDITGYKEMERDRAHLLHSQAFTDSLTGMANRRRFDESLASEWLRCGRQRSPLALLMIDVDDFKKYNDCFGHQAGDNCLKEMATILKEQIGRPYDLIARYGGDEFACLLPDTDMNGALHKGMAIVKAVRELGIGHFFSDTAPVVTVSLGGAVTVPSPDRQPDEILSVADEQLYQAKRNGRNQACGCEL